MNGGAERNVLQRQGVADKNICLGTGNDLHADLQSDGLQNVAVLAIGVAQKSDECGTVRIVLDGFDLGRNADFVAPEIDHAVMLLVSAASMAHRQLTVIVASVDAVLSIEQRLVRLVGRDLLLVIDDRFESQRMGLRSERLNCH